MGKLFSSIKWGISPNYRKDKTSSLLIKQVPLPPSVTIPLRQHIGAPCVPLVKKGDLVKKGQLIASAEAALSSNIHSSVSGKVTAILNKPNPVYGECQSIIIENDGLDEWAEGLPCEKRDWESLSKQELLGIIKKAGIVGMGGAAFPSHIKLAPPPDKKIDTLIINAAECEPFLTVDHRMMLECLDRLYIGVQIIKKLLGVEKLIIGVEDNKMDAVSVLKTVFPPNEVVTVPTRYPQGAEKILIKTLTAREVKPGMLPMDVGVVVQNVSTSVAIADAVLYDIPLIERVVTVSGGAIKNPANLRLRIGTSFEYAITMCGGLKRPPSKVVMGGPMMGIAQYTTTVPVIKGTSGILVLTEKDVRCGTEQACIRCGRCVENCPMGLNPGMLSILGERDFVEEARDEYHLLDCVECGCCSYSCPAKRNIVHYIKYAKKLCSEKNGAKKENKK